MAGNEVGGIFQPVYLLAHYPFSHKTVHNYLLAFSDHEGIFSNMRKHILDLQGLLYSEPRLLLLEELREPRNYFSILRAIAQGSTRLNEIAQKAGVGNSPTTARYLDILQHLRLVYRSVPATESQPGKSKKGFYHISDYFLRFWFRYVHPYQNSLDLVMADGILEQRVRPTFEQSVIIGRRMYVVSESDWHGYPTEPKTKNGSNTCCETMEQNQLLSVLKIGLYPGSTRASFSSTGYSSGFSNRLPDLTLSWSTRTS